MRLIKRWFMAVLVVPAAAWASQASPPAPAASSPAVAPSSLDKAHRQVDANQKEINRLQSDMAAQEAARKEASEQLRKRDQAIVELQQQLRELRNQPAPGSSR